MEEGVAAASSLGAQHLRVVHQADLFGAGRAGPVSLYLDNLGSDASRRSLYSVLKTVSEILSRGATRIPEAINWTGLLYDDAVRLRAELIRRYRRKPETARHYWSTFRGVCREAVGMDPAEWARILRLKRIPGKSIPNGRALDRWEVDRLVADVADGTPIGVRDAAIISVLYYAGLRREELVGIDVCDFEPADGTLRVIGKGNKERVLPLEPDTEPFKRLAAWLAVRGRAPGPVFVRVQGSRIFGTRISGNRLWGIISAAGKRCQLRRVSPHDLRRTFATHLFDGGAPLPVVQELMGHADASTTARYYRGSLQKQRAATRILTMRTEGER